MTQLHMFLQNWGAHCIWLPHLAEVCWRVSTIGHPARRRTANSRPESGSASTVGSPAPERAGSFLLCLGRWARFSFLDSAAHLTNND